MEQSGALHGALKHLLTLSQSLSNPSHDEGQKVLAAGPHWTLEAKEHLENGRTLADTPPKSSEMAFVLSGRQRPNHPKQGLTRPRKQNRRQNTTYYLEVRTA